MLAIVTGPILKAKAKYLYTKLTESRGPMNERSGDSRISGDSRNVMVSGEKLSAERNCQLTS